MSILPPILENRPVSACWLHYSKRGGGLFFLFLFFSCPATGDPADERYGRLCYVTSQLMVSLLSAWKRSLFDLGRVTTAGGVNRSTDRLTPPATRTLQSKMPESRTCGRPRGFSWEAFLLRPPKRSVRRFATNDPILRQKTKTKGSSLTTTVQN